MCLCVTFSLEVFFVFAICVFFFFQFHDLVPTVPEKKTKKKNQPEVLDDHQMLCFLCYYELRGFPRGKFPFFLFF